MYNFMNKPKKGITHDSECNYVSNMVMDSIEDIIRIEISKHDLTVNDVNNIIYYTMRHLIKEFVLEYSDFKDFIKIWEDDMRENEKVRREMWD